MARTYRISLVDEQGTLLETWPIEVSTKADLYGVGKVAPLNAILRDAVGGIEDDIIREINVDLTVNGGGK